MKRVALVALAFVAGVSTMLTFQYVDKRTSITHESCGPTMVAAMGGEERIVCVTHYTSQITGREYWDYDNARVFTAE